MKLLHAMMLLRLVKVGQGYLRLLYTVNDAAISLAVALAERYSADWMSEIFCKLCVESFLSDAFMNMKARQVRARLQHKIIGVRQNMRAAGIVQKMSKNRMDEAEGRRLHTLT